MWRERDSVVRRYSVGASCKLLLSQQPPPHHHHASRVHPRRREAGVKAGTHEPSMSADTTRQMSAVDVGPCVEAADTDGRRDDPTRGDPLRVGRRQCWLPRDTPASASDSFSRFLAPYKFVCVCMCMYTLSADI